MVGLQEGPGRFFADHSLSRAPGPPALQTGRPRPPGKGPLTWKVLAVAESKGLLGAQEPQCSLGAGPASQEVCWLCDPEVVQKEELEGFPSGLVVTTACCQCRDQRFDP